MTKLNVIEIIRFIRTQETLKNSLVVLGGSDVTHDVENYLAAGADLIVIGEGEQTMLEIALTVDGGRWTVNEKDALCSTTAMMKLPSAVGHIPVWPFACPTARCSKLRRGRNRDMDRLPFPNRQKINLQQS